MADTSGSVVGNAVTVSGGHTAYIFTNWQLASQNVGGDYSTINWQTYMHFNNCDAQLDNGSTNSNVGNLWSNGGRVYNYAGNFSTRDMGLASGSFNIGHDSGGNGYLQLGNSIAVYGSGTSSATSGVWTLPVIPRYANIIQADRNNITDTGFDFVLGADNTCDYFTYWINGGAHNDTPFIGSNYTFNIRNLPISDQDYTVTGAVRRQDSGLWTTGSTYTVHTLPQNGFLGLF
jgi:hypothetical protein